MPDIRLKSKELLVNALKSHQPQAGQVSSDEDIQSLAESIEAAIYRHHNNQVDAGYKESVRSRIFNLKDSANPLCQSVLSGEIDPDTFANFSADDMARPEFRRNQEQLRRKSIIDSMGYEEIQPRHRDLDNLDEDRP